MIKFSGGNGGSIEDAVIIWAQNILKREFVQKRYISLKHFYRLKMLIGKC